MKGFNVLMVLLLAGCTYRGPSQPIDGWDLYNTYLRIEARRTTKKDIQRWLGTPYLKTRDNLGREKWIYKTTSPFSPDVRLDVTFDEDGKVILYFIEGEGEGRKPPP